MSLIRKLNNGKWNKPPVLTAARLVFAKGLAEKYPGCELGDMAEFVNGTSYDRARLDMGDTPIIRISNITDPTSDFIRTDEQFPDRYHVSNGDLLVSWSASFKSILWPGPEGILNQHIFKVTESNGHMRSYIRHSIEAAFDEMQRNVVGIGMMHLRRKDFLGHQVPCPPADVQSAVAQYLDWIEGGCDGKEPPLPPDLEEQRRIVAKIERLAAKIDEAHRLRDTASAGVTALDASLLAAVIPKDVGTRALGELIQPGTTISYGVLKPGPDIAGGVPFVRVGDLSIDSPSPRPEKSISPSVDAGYARTRLKGGEVLIAVVGSIGKVGIAPYSWAGANIARAVARIVPGPELLPSYLASVLKAGSIQRYLLDTTRTLAQPTLNIKQLKETRIPVPPLNEQRRIVAYLDDLQTKVERLKGLQQKTAAELDALLPSILDKAFKGEL